MAEQVKPWFHLDFRGGHRELDQQMQGLSLLMRSVKKATVLDLGCAEGLITIEMAKAGATALHGIEIRRQAVIDANVLRGDLPITFEVGDLNVWRAQRHYDVVVMLAILHKLKDPAKVLRWILTDASPDLIVIRLPPRSDNPVVYDSRSGSKKIDLWPIINKAGYKMLHVTDGYLAEWIGYYRKAE
jgi:trans-aconitate methyltransferase